MAKISEQKKIEQYILESSENIRKYFKILPELLEKISSSEPALAYCFQRLEAAQRSSIYVILMREYRTNSALTWETVDSLDISRKSFPKIFESISGLSLPNSIRDNIEPAEKIRDDIMHGRKKTKAEICQAILLCLKHASNIDEQFSKKVGFKPFGDLRGVTSKKGSPQLDEKISKAVLAGLKLIRND